MQVNIRWNVSDLAAIDCNLISQHAGCRNLDRIWPVVIIVAKSVCEVENGILRNQGCVLCNVEMSWLHSTLGDRVRNKEEVETSLNDL